MYKTSEDDNPKYLMTRHPTMPYCVRCEMPKAVKTDYEDMVKDIDGMAQAVKKLTDDRRPEVIASAVEFILEGLHLSRKLNCDRSGESAVYKR